MPTTPAAIATRTTRELDRLSALLAERVAQIVRTHTTPDQPVTNDQRRRIMRDVDDAFAIVYGEDRGDTDAMLYQYVVTGAHEAQLAAYEQMIERWREQLGDDVVDAILASEGAQT